MAFAFQLSHDLIKAFLITAGSDNARAKLRQIDGRGLADAACGTCNQDRPPLKRHGIERHRAPSIRLA